MTETTSALWTSKDVIGAVVATRIISAAASWIFELIKAAFNKRAAGRYGAMQSAVALERYAVDCWNVFSMGEGEFEMYHSVSQVTLPQPPALATDIDWKAIDPAIADDVLSFSNVTSVSEAMATYTAVWEQNPHDFHEVARDRGFAALKLAAKIRRHYRMMSHNEFDRLWKDLAK